MGEKGLGECASELSEQFGIDPLVLLQKVAEVPSGVGEGMELGGCGGRDEHGRRQGRGVADGVERTAGGVGDEIAYAAHVRYGRCVGGKLCRI